MILVFHLPDDFWLKLPAEGKANFLMTFANSIMTSSAPEVFQFCIQTYMGILEYSNTVLAECPVMSFVRGQITEKQYVPNTS